MTRQPLLFHPILLEKVWGGRFLGKLGKRLPHGTGIGESWELADLPDSIPGGRSVIANGPAAGRTLREVIGADPEAIMGAASLSPEGGFPLLIKYLDARENLSVQVHPDEAYAKRHPEAHLKSEAWVIIHAEPGAVIYKGLKPGIDRECFQRMLKTGDVPDALDAVRAVPGECHYLPSGTVHALGAGVVVAEVQTPSDTTFRLYDWGRDSGTGGRALHIEQALECARFEPCEPQTHPPSIESGGVRTTRLARTPHFTIEKLEAEPGADLAVVTSGLPEVWMVMAGSIEIESPPSSVQAPLGATLLMPAALPDSEVRIAESATILRITLPSPLEGAIA